MNGLPPVEAPQLQTSHLRTPDAGWKLSLSGLRDSLTALPSFSVPQSGRWVGVAAVTLLPVALVLWAQPHAPGMERRNSQLVSAYVTSQESPVTQPRTALAQAATADQAPTQTDTTSRPTPAPQTATPPTVTAADTTQNAQLVSAATTPEEKAYRYQLTLAQGFLNKAVQYSQDTSTQQTANDKDTIMSFLNQALDASNAAIDVNATNGLGFLMRARIYKTASTIDPNLAAKSDQDLAIARALGIQDADALDTNVLQYLPTQQANEVASAPIIADPESGSQTEVTTETGDNYLTGEVILPAGTTEVFVPFPRLNNTMQVSAQIATTSNFQPHTPVRIAGRKNGEGFTIQSFNTHDQDITLAWQVIQE